MPQEKIEVQANGSRYTDTKAILIKDFKKLYLETEISNLSLIIDIVNIYPL